MESINDAGEKEVVVTSKLLDDVNVKPTFEVEELESELGETVAVITSKILDVNVDEMEKLESVDAGETVAVTSELLVDDIKIEFEELVRSLEEMVKVEFAQLKPFTVPLGQ